MSARCFGRGDGICAFGGAPRRTARRAGAVCSRAMRLSTPPRKPLAPARVSTLKSRRKLFPSKNRQTKMSVCFLVEATGFVRNGIAIVRHGAIASATTSWSRTSSQQDESGRVFVCAKYRAHNVCCSSSRKKLCFFAGTLFLLARLVEGHKRL